MSKCPKTIYQAAAYWQEKGLDPLPIPHIDGRSVKGPRNPGWHVAATAGHSPEEFRGDVNLGGLLGGPRNLGDVDVDAYIQPEPPFGTPSTLC